MAVTRSELKVALEEPVAWITPEEWSTLSDIQVGRHVYEGLLSHNHSMELHPSLAVSWEELYPAQVWRFRIRPKRRFHDGIAIDAEAVRWNLEQRIQWNIGIAHLIDRLDVQAVDEIVIGLKKPFTPFLDRLASPQAVLVSPSSARLQGEECSPGSGPYLVEERHPDGSVLLGTSQPRGNKDHHFETIRFLPLGGGINMWRALIDRRVDLIYECPYQLIADPSLTPDFPRHTCGSLSVNMLALNLNREPFRERSVRRRVGQAIDQALLVKKGNLGVGLPALGPIAPRSRYFRDPRVGDRQAQSEARGQDQPQNNATVKINVLARTGYTSVWLEIFEQQLRRAAFDCKITRLPFHQLLQRTSSGNFEAALVGVGGSPNPDQLLFELFHGQGRSNRSRFAHDPFDRLINRARSEHDFLKRRGFYTKAVRILLRETPAVFLRHGMSILGHHKSLRCVVPFPDHYLRLETAYFG